MKRRHQAEKDSSSQGKDGCKNKQGHVDLDSAGDDRDRRRSGEVGTQIRHSPQRHDKPSDTAKDGKHHGLGEQLPHDPDPSGPQCRPYCNFLTPGSHPRQQQVGNVCAGDHQDEEDGQEHYGKGCPGIFPDIFPESHQGNAPPAIRLRISLGHLGGDQFHLGSGLGYRHAFRQTTGDVQGPVVTVAYRDEVEGDPEIVGPAVEEIRRHDADDGVRIPIQDNRRSDRGWIRIQIPIEETLSDDCDSIRPGNGVLGNKAAAAIRLNPDDLENVRRRHQPHHADRYLTAGYVERDAVFRGKAIEACRPVLPVEVVRQ